MLCVLCTYFAHLCHAASIYTIYPTGLMNDLLDDRFQGRNIGM